MSETFPPELAKQLSSYLQEVNGEYIITDMLGLIGFILEHGKEYPGLYDIIEIDEDKIVEMYEKTGEVPPGIKLVRKTPREDSNVTDLEIQHGLIPPREK
jgi:hypothetical protein